MVLVKTAGIYRVQIFLLFIVVVSTSDFVHGPLKNKAFGAPDSEKCASPET